MSKYKRYERYKDSGVEWIGEIPEEWEVTKLGYRTRMIVPMRDKPTEFNGNIPWIRIEDVDGKYIEDSKSEQRVSKEIVKKMNLKVYPIGTVLCTCSCNMGTTVIVKKPLISNQTFIGIVPIKDLDSTFLYYVMNANSKRLQYLAEGAIQQYLSRHDFEHLKLAFPDKEEQITIANFLDQKTDEIDGLIADKEKLIELLQEKRQAIIDEAVTKGINPNARMKDSGIEWIGEIPEHWEIVKLKRCFKVINGKEIVNEVEFDDSSGINVYGSGGVFKKTDKYLFRGESVLFGRKGTIGKPIYVNESFWTVDTMYYTKYKMNMVPKWFYYMFIIYPWEAHTTQTALPSIVGTEIENDIWAIPSYKEQREMVKMLNKKTLEIDELILEVGHQIVKLKEYRQSLITEVVTGKIKV